MRNEFLHELFVDCLKTLYSAEKQLLSKGLPAMIEATENATLREAFEEHLTQTEEQVKRLEKISQELDIPINGKKSLAIEGIVQESEELIRDDNLEKKVKDIGLNNGAMKVEHYEIVVYTAAVNLALSMDHTEAAELLKETLNEEIETNALLEKLAEDTFSELE